MSQAVPENIKALGRLQPRTLSVIKHGIERAGAVARRILEPPRPRRRSSGDRKSVKGIWLSEIPETPKVVLQRVLPGKRKLKIVSFGKPSHQHTKRITSIQTTRTTPRKAVKLAENAQEPVTSSAIPEGSRQLRTTAEEISRTLTWRGKTKQALKLSCTNDSKIGLTRVRCVRLAG